MSIGQLLPGPNVFNLMVVLARHLHGTMGVVMSSIGILAVPFCSALLLGSLYVRFGNAPAVRQVMSGIAPVAAGLMLSFGFKIASAPSLRSLLGIVAILTFVAVAFLRVSLPVVLLVMAPLGCLIASRRL